MSRRHAAIKRTINPDAKFGNVVVAKFMNSVMMRGQKNTAEKIVYGAIARLEEKTKKNGLETFLEALEKVKPLVEVKSRRVGGATYQVPVEVRPDRRQALAIRWIIDAARKRSEKTMEERLFGELMDVMADRGNALRKREDVHKMAEANKAFSHYKW